MKSLNHDTFLTRQKLPKDIWLTDRSYGSHLSRKIWGSRLWSELLDLICRDKWRIIWTPSTKCLERFGIEIYETALASRVLYNIHRDILGNISRSWRVEVTRTLLNSVLSCNGMKTISILFGLSIRDILSAPTIGTPVRVLFSQRNVSVSTD